MMARQRIHDAERLTAPCLANVVLIACKAQDGRGYCVDSCLAGGMMVRCAIRSVWGRRAPSKADKSNVYRGSCRYCSIGPLIFGSRLLLVEFTQQGSTVFT